MLAALDRADARCAALKAENDKLLESAAWMLDEIEQRRANDGKARCIWCGLIAPHAETSEHVKTCEKSPSVQIIERAKDLRRRAHELDEEFNHEDGSTVENALAYVLGDEPAESCIILQMHRDAAAN